MYDHVTRLFAKEFAFFYFRKIKFIICALHSNRIIFYVKMENFIKTTSCPSVEEKKVPLQKKALSNLNTAH